MGRLADRFPIYSRLLWLYPRPYRDTYGEQMLQTLADMIDNDPTQTGRIRIYTHAMVDLPMSLLNQQAQYIGGIMVNETPRYIRRNSLIAGSLLVPFFGALIANALSKLIGGQTLYNNWLWQAPVLTIWVLWLPVLASLITVITAIVYIWRQSKIEHGHTFKTLLNIRQDWPLLIVATVGLGILAIVLGHDSAHCIAGNPVREVQQWHQTWHCIQQGAATYPFQHPLTFLKRAFGLN